MRLEQRGRIKPPSFAFNWRQEETRDNGETVHHSKTSGVRGLRGRESQRGLRRRGQRDDRRLRNELEGQSVSNLEPDAVGKLCPAARKGGGDSEEDRRGTHSRRPDRGGSRGADGCQADAGAGPRTYLSARLVRLPAR